jgi:divalent metal cation (Fe/Co/Zn/Cd) transporter
MLCNEKNSISSFSLGRARLEPIAIVILSVIMCSASVIVIYESVDTINQDIGYFTHPNDTSSKYTLPDIDMTTIPVVVMIVTIGKFAFFII